jgi:hypothetical protein
MCGIERGVLKCQISKTNYSNTYFEEHELWGFYDIILLVKQHMALTLPVISPYLRQYALLIFVHHQHFSHECQICHRSNPSART